MDFWSQSKSRSTRGRVLESKEAPLSGSERRRRPKFRGKEANARGLLGHSEVKVQQSRLSRHLAPNYSNHPTRFVIASAAISRCLLASGGALAGSINRASGVRDLTAPATESIQLAGEQVAAAAAAVHVGLGGGPNGHYYETGDVPPSSSSPPSPSSSSIGRPALPVREQREANGSGGNDSVAPGDTGSHLLLLFIILVVINLIVILGNILVIVAFYKSAKLRNVTNIFIVSLATADLLLGIFVLPYALMFEVSLSLSLFLVRDCGPTRLGGSGNYAPAFGRLIYAHIIIIIIISYAMKGCPLWRGFRRQLRAFDGPPARGLGGSRWRLCF